MNESHGPAHLLVQDVRLRNCYSWLGIPATTQLLKDRERCLRKTIYFGHGQPFFRGAKTASAVWEKCDIPSKDTMDRKQRDANISLKNDTPETNTVLAKVSNS